MPRTYLRHFQRLVTGPGAIQELSAELAASGIENALVVCGQGVANSAVLKTVLDVAAGKVGGAFDRCSANAPIDIVQQISQRVRDEHIDGLISVGGGSSHDAAKGASVLFGEGGTLADHATYFSPPDKLVVPVLRGKRLPIIAVATTFSAAEATASAGFHDRVGRTKIVLVDHAAPIRTVILDPQLAASTPRPVLAASVGNALNHCVEAIYSTGHGQYTDALATSALRMLWTSADKALQGDLGALEECQVGAYLSGLAMPPSGLGVNHALCHILGVFGASHGGANSAMLAHGMRFNLSWSTDRLAIVARVIGSDDASAAADRLQDKLRTIGAPTDLRTLGIQHEDLPMIASRALHDRHMFANPRPVADPHELESLLETAW